MSAVLNPATGAPSRGAARRSREELEKMAAEWVAGAEGSTPAAHPAPARTVRILAVGASLALALAMGAGVFLRQPGERPAAALPAAPQPAPVAEPMRAAEARKAGSEATEGGDYLEKMAAADEALLQDLRRNRQAFEPRPEPAAVTPPPPAQNAEPSAAGPAAAIQAPPEAAASVSAPTPTPALAQEAKPDNSAAEAAAPPTRPAPAPATSVPATSALKANCRIHVSELSPSGRLTYADIARVKGARKDPKTGHVFTPAVKLNDGSSTVFEVMPNGCARIVRSARR